MDIHSTSSHEDYDDETLLINSANLANSKEGKLKGIPPDVSYATFAGKTPAEIYDKVCSIGHFGHMANRILRKLISANYIDAACGNTLGKNRKVRAEQKRYFEELSELGVQYLHQIIKTELDSEGSASGIVLPPMSYLTAQSQDVLASKRAAPKKVAEPTSASSSSSSSSAVGAKRTVDVVAPQVSASSLQAITASTAKSTAAPANYDAMTKTDLVEVLQSVFKSSRHAELQAHAIAKENAEKEHFAELQKQTALAHKQASIKFLQEQLKEAKLTAAKKKEFEAKLEELLNTICDEM